VDISPSTLATASIARTALSDTREDASGNGTYNEGPDTARGVFLLLGVTSGEDSQEEASQGGFQYGRLF
jgi:hypothetical protein